MGITDNHDFYHGRTCYHEFQLVLEDSDFLSIIKVIIEEVQLLLQQLDDAGRAKLDECWFGVNILALLTVSWWLKGPFRLFKNMLKLYNYCCLYIRNHSCSLVNSDRIGCQIISFFFQLTG